MRTTGRAWRAAVRGALEGSLPGSWTRPLGSLATGEADDYSVVDVEWIVPDDASRTTPV